MSSRPLATTGRADSAAPGDPLADVCRQALLLARQTLTEIGTAGRTEVRDAHVVDISTQGDRAVSAALIGLFEKQRLPAVLLSEETGRRQLHPHPRLTVAFDDIDGTDNYFRGRGLLPHCTVVTIFDSALPRFADACVAGIVEHNSGRLWLAQRGRGCTVDAAPARTSGRTGLDRRCLVAVDHYSSHGAIAQLDNWYSAAWIKDFGSSALHLAGVSSGLFDAYAGSAQKAHELGAGYLLIREAGGCLLDWHGRVLDDRSYDFDATWPVVAAATPALAQSLLDLLGPVPIPSRHGA